MSTRHPTPPPYQRAAKLLREAAESNRLAIQSGEPPQPHRSKLEAEAFEFGEAALFLDSAIGSTLENVAAKFRSFPLRYPELPDVSTIAIAQELIDELDPVLQHAVILYLASRFGVTL